MSFWFPVADCSTLTDQRLKSFANRSQLAAVLVCGTTRSPWPAERKWRRAETAETKLIIDTRYGAKSWWRHLYTSIQISKSTQKMNYTKSTLLFSNWQLEPGAVCCLPVQLTSQKLQTVLLRLQLVLPQWSRAYSLSARVGPVCRTRRLQSHSLPSTTDVFLLLTSSAEQFCNINPAISIISITA